MAQKFMRKLWKLQRKLWMIILMMAVIGTAVLFLLLVIALIYIYLGWLRFSFVDYDIITWPIIIIFVLVAFLLKPVSDNWPEFKLLQLGFKKFCLIVVIWVVIVMLVHTLVVQFVIFQDRDIVIFGHHPFLFLLGEDPSGINIIIGKMRLIIILILLFLVTGVYLFDVARKSENWEVRKSEAWKARERVRISKNLKMQRDKDEKAQNLARISDALKVQRDKDEKAREEARERKKRTDASNKKSAENRLFRAGRKPSLDDISREEEKKTNENIDELDQKVESGFQQRREENLPSEVPPARQVPQHQAPPAPPPIPVRQRFYQTYEAIAAMSSGSTSIPSMRLSKNLDESLREIAGIESIKKVEACRWLIAYGVEGYWQVRGVESVDEGNSTDPIKLQNYPPYEMIAAMSGNLTAPLTSMSLPENLYKSLKKIADIESIKEAEACRRLIAHGAKAYWQARNKESDG